MLHGPEGAGKTHLAAVWKTVSKASSVSPQSLQSQDVVSLARESGALLFEDIDRFLSSAEGEEILFHLINSVRAEGGSLLLTSRLAPSELNVALPDLKSRLTALPVASLGKLDDELLEMLLVKMFHDRQLRVSGELVRYALARTERSARAVRTLVEEIDRISLAERREVTIPLVRRVFEEMEIGEVSR